MAEGGPPCSIPQNTPVNIEMGDISIQNSQTSDNYNATEVNSCTTEITPSHLVHSSEKQAGDQEELEENFFELRLDLLPAELLLHICSFLDAKIVLHTLAKVSASLKNLLSSDTFWKVRIGKRWPQKYPAIPVNDAEFDWKAACVAREEQHRLWSNHSTNMEHFVFTEGIFGAVDSIHLMKNGSLLAAGSRDRYLNLLDLNFELDSGKSSRVFSKMNAHSGWIWSMSSLGDTLATGSWDTYIHFWDLAAGGQIQHKVKCKSAVLCTHYEPNAFLAGGYDKKVYHIDPRSAGGIVAEKRYHKKPVLCLAADEKYCVSGSEDGTVVVYDRRADAVFKTVKLEDTYPMSLSYGSDQLWVGDKSGSVHLLDATDGDFTLVQSYEKWHSGKVTGVVHGLGSLVTCSTDGTVQLRHPTLQPQLMATLNPGLSDVAKICFQNEVLACAYSKSAVGVWRPKPVASCL